MRTHKEFVVAGLLLAGALFPLNAKAQALTYNVSADPGNNLGTFSWVGNFFSSHWVSGDIQLTSAPTLSTSPLEIDLVLSHNLILNNPDGIENYGWALNSENVFPSGGDLGDVQIELLENGAVVTPQFGYDLPNPFGSDVNTYATKSSTYLTPGLAFNGIDVFITDSNPEGNTITDFEVALNTPDTSNTLPLLLLGVGALFGFASRKANALCRQVS